MSISILTLHWNAKDKLEKLYPSLLEAVAGLDWSWYIKDNNSTDGSKELVKSWNNPNVHLIEYPHNKDNFATGCNFLFRTANPKDDDFVLLLNNDIVFGDNVSLKNMMALFEDPSVGIVGAKLLYPDSNKIQHAGVVFSLSHGLPVHFSTNENDSEILNKNREFQAVTGAVLLTKAKYYKAAHTNASGNVGMDENLQWCFDDIDFCLAVKNILNKKILYCGNTKIFHEESASLKKNPINRIYLNKNALYFLKKWTGKYKLDYIEYKSNPNHNVYSK